MSPKYDQYDLLEEFNEIKGAKPRLKNVPKKVQRPRRKDKYNLITEPEVAQAIFAQRDDIRFLDFTYQASRTERGYLVDSLGSFYDERWFDDVLQIVKGGKEASVYQCKGTNTTGADFIAAKVYRPRMFRALRNDTAYREGRALLDEDGLAVKDHGKLKAVHKGSAFGKEVTHTSWLEHEVKTMQALSAAGLDVPRFYASNANAILMEYVGDAEAAAPALIDVRLDTTEARPLYQRVVHNLEGMLRLGIVHGDLSAYNILYWEGDITFIDFPQALNPRQNRNAYNIFERDVTRVCEYFAKQGVKTDSKRLISKLWTSHQYSLTPDFDLAVLDPDDEADAAFWKITQKRLVKHDA
jgi:RIO kinase 1